MNRRGLGAIAFRFTTHKVTALSYNKKVTEKPRTQGKGRRPPGMTQSSQRRGSVS